MRESLYSLEPLDKQRFTADFDQFYTRFARIYEWAIKLFPTWRSWISHVLPYVQGPRVLEVSIGTGYLLNRYPPDSEVIGIDYNREMIRIARRNAKRRARPVSFQQADVSHLPFQSGTFDTVVNTMAFTAYPDGHAAMAELSRVLRDGGRLVMVDINHPGDGNRPGVFLSNLWIKFGDIVRDMAPIFQEASFEYLDEEIGGFGSVHLYIAVKVK